MAIEFRLPHFTGSDREQISQIRSYLYQFIPQLQWALNSIETAAPSYVVKETHKSVASSSQSFNASDIKLTKSLNAQGWYKVGTLSGDMCAVATLTVGGIFVNNQVSPSMVNIATQYNGARVFLSIPSLVENQISKIGLVKESATVYGVYAYYNTTNENTVSINIHIHMGTFVSANLEVASVTDGDMISFINVKE
jgi:hypothetical protein